MPVGCLGNTSSTDQKDLRNHSISGSHLEEGGGNGNINQVKTKLRPRCRRYLKRR